MFSLSFASTFFTLNNAVLFGQRATKRRSCKGATFRDPVTLAQPKQCFVCAKFAQNKGKTLCSLLVLTQLFRTRNEERSIFRLVYLGF